jgi:hypothetical protein
VYSQNYQRAFWRFFFCPLQLILIPWLLLRFSSSLDFQNTHNLLSAQITEQALEAFGIAYDGRP